MTVQSTCATAGEKKLVCECGESKVESIPATGNHNWVEGTTVIHHEELGQTELDDMPHYLTKEADTHVETGTNPQ